MMQGVQTPGEPQPFPSAIRPMLATLVDKPFSPWVAEDLAAYTGSEMVVDGEMAALNDKGLPCSREP